MLVQLEVWEVWSANINMGPEMSLIMIDNVNLGDFQVDCCQIALIWVLVTDAIG